jgi:predicted HicB family RNase H-like nuclease
MASMGKKKEHPTEDTEMVKTTLRLSAAVWKKARVRALDERVSFQEIVERALTEYLKGGRS